MSDPIHRSWLARVAEDAARLPASDTLRLVADPASGAPPRRYRALLRDVEHFEPALGGTVRLSQQPLLFEIDFPEDYCRAVDGTLSLRVVRVRSPFVHPNASAGGTLCLGAGFRPSTRLRPLLHQVYEIAAGRAFATQSALDPRARDFFLGNLAQVRALRAPPLWAPAATEAAR
jgi:hypothetical protein